MKYFIEDKLTKKWYRNLLYYEKELEKNPFFDYWTNDPTDALMSENKEYIEDVLKGLRKSESLSIMTDVYGVYREIEITEHEFI